jgi:deoxyribonuclease-1
MSLFKRFFAFLMCVMLSACSLEELKGLLMSAEAPPAVERPENLPQSPATFELAKKKLYNEIYQGHAITFYCGCSYNPRTRDVDWRSCGYVPRRNAERAARIEAEHVMPAHQFGNFRQCWREPEQVCGRKMSGRKCCEEKDPVFNTAHNDLMNLFPAIGEVNGDRSNFNWGEIPGEQREYGACTMEVDESIRRAEPPEHVKGDIARTMFYMEKTYGFRLSDQDRKLYTAWGRMDPPDEWEQERNARIARVQGQDNPFVSRYGEEPELIRRNKTSAAQTPVTPPAEPAPQPVSGPAAPVEVPAAVSAAQDDGFSCEPRKSCSRMSSCEEALFQLRQCGNTAIDGNNDGIPCSSLCREQSSESFR